MVTGVGWELDDTFVVTRHFLNAANCRDGNALQGRYGVEIYGVRERDKWRSNEAFGGVVT